jgi:hypothetical protein
VVDLFGVRGNVIAVHVIIMHCVEVFAGRDLSMNVTWMDRYPSQMRGRCRLNRSSEFPEVSEMLRSFTSFARG